MGCQGMGLCIIEQNNQSTGKDTPREIVLYEALPIS
jgi:hypothetical protein